MEKTEEKGFVQKAELMTKTEMKMSAAKDYGTEILSGAYIDDYGKLWWYSIVPSAEEVVNVEMIHPEIHETRDVITRKDKAFYDYASEEGAVYAAYKFVEENYDTYLDATKDDIAESLVYLVSECLKTSIDKANDIVTNEDIDEAYRTREVQEIAESICDEYKQ